ncbi:MAG: hypothetical protein IK068_07180, partial [Lachnospiraceae bacterium]|nr:hypothetical protein [Lachnospiraceae bacterium]
SIVLFFALMILFMEKNGERLYKFAGIFFILVLLFTSFNDGLTSDRVVVRHVQTFNLFPEDDYSGKSVGTTWDINWGDAGLLKSIPAELGFKVFIDGEESEHLDSVDYVLTTYRYIEKHPELLEDLEYVSEAEKRYLVYKVK